MLINEEAEGRITRIIQAISGSYAVFMIGKDLGQSTIEAIGSALTSRKMTFLEQSFMAGRIASEIGTDKLKRMSRDEVANWITSNNVVLNEVELAALKALRRDTERWLQGRSNNWQSKFKTALASADKSWRGSLSAGTFTDANSRSIARNEALNELIDSLRGQNTQFKGEIDRLLQTEMHSYFQQGQMTSIPGNEMVYKIPRATACSHCMRLHLDSVGAPKLYRLSDVIGNSNWGRPAHSWQFTIGPVHPYCYCVLHRVVDKPAPPPNIKLSSARRQTLKKAAEGYSLTNNECNVSDSPHTIFEEVLLKTVGKEEIPAHEQMMLGVLQEIYGDSYPALNKEQAEQE